MSSYISIPDDYPGFPVEAFCIPPCYADSLECVLVSGGMIKDRIQKLAEDIANDIGSESFLALCVLKGGYKFFAELIEQIKEHQRLSKVDAMPVEMEFIRLKSYEDDQSTGSVRVLGVESLNNTTGRNILIVEDIIDTGATMQKLLTLLRSYNPKSIKVVSLVLKRTPLSTGFRPDYLGFEIPAKFVVGYALDYNEYFRDLNHMCVLNEVGKEKYKHKPSQSQ